MSTPQPPGPPDGPPPSEGTAEDVLAYPLTEADPPRVDEFWLDARLLAQPSGVTYLAHDGRDRPVLLVLLSEGAADDLAARERFAGRINALHIDDVVARGGKGQDEGRLARRFRPEGDVPPVPGQAATAPWAALAHDGPESVRRTGEILDDVQLAMVPPQGTPSGPDYRHYWIDRVRPGLTRLWPLPWPGRHTRAGWVSILVSWLLMMLLAALAVLIAIWIFHDDPPQAPPPPSGQTSSPQSGSPPPDSGSPSPDSASPSPESASPSSASPSSGSPSPDSASPSPTEGSPSQTPSMSGSPSPSGTESGGGEPSDSGPPGSPSPRSRL
ncbi:hypothetical protein GC722_15865 [Auraticoccus sp. F435]|uniref:Uncharacterized protein n=1 Tax=Auraticoccus cholistanensis TaxID=2656650 RepID=A0A6A9V1M3_9ACTN|nr:hypothetical protein [Auraticoccus cholistanensis]MVA77483.1 hypothetical protein [Auraticoccus cholistanensis]